MIKFFTAIFDLMKTDNCMIDITIARKNGKLTVGVMPKAILKDELDIPVLNITGTPEELDQDFIKAISAPVSKSAGIISNEAEFEKELEDKASKTASKKKENEDVEKIVAEAGKIEKEDKNNVAAIKAIIEKGLKKYPDNKRLLSNLELLNQRQPNLFGKKEMKETLLPSEQRKINADKAVKVKPAPAQAPTMFDEPVEEESTEEVEITTNEDEEAEL